MATSPPLEERVNLYLIVSLPFSPGSFHHFFIYSASILADSRKEKSLKVYLTFPFGFLFFFGYTISKKKYEHTQGVASRMWRRESASTLSMQLRSELEIQHCVCPFHNDLKCSHEISIPTDQSGLRSPFLSLSSPHHNPDHISTGAPQRFQLALWLHFLTFLKCHNHWILTARTNKPWKYTVTNRVGRRDGAVKRLMSTT